MRVVSNTSPLSNLPIIGRLDLLRRRYHRILIPSEVASELAALSHPPGSWSIQSASSQGWLVVTETTRRAAVPFPLDSGETAAISLALSVKADVLLIDEKRGRAAARSLGENPRTSGPRQAVNLSLCLETNWPRALPQRRGAGPRLASIRLYGFRIRKNRSGPSVSFQNGDTC